MIVDKKVNMKGGTIVSRSRDRERGNESYERYRPPRRNYRAVQSLDSSLHLDSYDPYQAPIERLEYNAILERTPGRQPNVTIMWENQPMVRVGRAGGHEKRS